MTKSGIMPNPSRHQQQGVDMREREGYHVGAVADGRNAEESALEDGPVMHKQPLQFSAQAAANSDLRMM